MSETEREALADVLLPFVQKVCTCHMFNSSKRPHDRGCETRRKAEAAADAVGLHLHAVEAARSIRIAQ